MAHNDDQDGVDRFGVSLPAGLLEDLDEMVREKGYNNRSLAIADMGPRQAGGSSRATW